MLQDDSIVLTMPVVHMSMFFGALCHNHRHNPVFRHGTRLVHTSRVASDMGSSFKLSDPEQPLFYRMGSSEFMTKMTNHYCCRCILDWHVSYSECRQDSRYCTGWFISECHKSKLNLHTQLVDSRQMESHPDGWRFPLTVYFLLLARVKRETD